MTITIKHRAFAQIVKNTAKMVLPLTSKKERLQKEIIKLANEIAEVDGEIATYQERVKEISGGLTTEQLVVRRKDAEGNYIPGFEANPEFVYFDEEKRVYVVRDLAAEAEAAEATAESHEEVDPASAF